MSGQSELRPGALATFPLASGDLMPRQRARDQQADIAGLALKRRVLDMIVSRDPGGLELCLAQIVEEVGAPTGPTRAICQSVLEEWTMAEQNPAFVEWLLGEAISEGQRSGEPRRRRRGQGD